MMAIEESNTNAMPERQRLAASSSDYVRFIILSGARTGSHMLAQALNSGPTITCFREVFNPLLGFIQFDVAGYENFSAQDLGLRESDPIRFLHSRIFCERPKEVRAVGFKFHYTHGLGFPGITQHLVEEKDLRVLHLRRRNLLRMLVSLKFAQMTGVWSQKKRPRVKVQKALAALRHPLKAAARVPGLIHPPRVGKDRTQLRVTIQKEEFFNFVVRAEMNATSFDERFREHPKLTVYYEDMLDNRKEVFDRVQSFLGIEPGPLTVTLRQQNPAPLRDLVENYEELYEEYRSSPCAAFFD